MRNFSKLLGRMAIGLMVLLSSVSTIQAQTPPAPVIEVTPSSLDFSSIPVGQVTGRVFTVRNTGGGTLSGSATVQAPFSILSGGSYSLGAGQSASIEVLYRPTAPGTYNSNVTFTGGAGASRPVTGRSEQVAPAMEVTPSSLDFGFVPWGDALSRNFTVKNKGGGTLSGIATVPAPFSIVSGGSYSLGAGQSASVTVLYRPTANGTQSGNVIFSGGVGAVRPVTGRTEQPPVIEVIPSGLLDFGTVQVGSTRDKAFSVKNTGGSTLTGNATIPAPFSIVSGGSYSLSAGQSGKVIVKYSPTAFGTLNNNNVTFTGGAGASRPVTGRSEQPPALEVTPSSLDFGTVRVGTTADRTFSIKNKGGGTFSGNATTQAPFIIAYGGEYSLGAGASGTVTVRYSPVYDGTHRGIVQFAGSGGIGISSSGGHEVTGRADRPAAISVTPANQDFGTVQVGSTADRTFTVRNTGGGTLSGIATAQPPFSIVSGGTYSPTAGATGTVTVRYSPTAPGTYSSNVTFTGGGGASRPVTGRAEQVTPVLEVTPSHLDFGTASGGNPVIRNFNVKNIGGGILSGIATAQPPFSIVSGGTYSLPANQGVLVEVRYSPTNPGPHSSNVTFTGGGGASRPVTGR